MFFNVFVVSRVLQFLEKKSDNWRICILWSVSKLINQISLESIELIETIVI